MDFHVFLYIVYFNFLWDHSAHSGYFEKRILLKPVRGGRVGGREGRMQPCKIYYC